MKETILTTVADLDWLFSTHLKHRSDRAQFNFAILGGNEDCPESVLLYVSAEPPYNEQPVVAISDYKARVTCDSGIEGWQCKLQDNYASFEEFESYSTMRGLAERLGYGFEGEEEAWNDNPTIQGSVNPSDFRKV